MGQATKTTVGHQLRDLRERAGLRQDELARRARESGLRDWTSATVAAIETNRREVSLSEWVALRGFAIRDDELSLSGVLSEEASNRRISGRQAAQIAAQLDAEIKAARRLGVQSEEVVSAARQLWGRTLTEERDHRVAMTVGIGGLVHMVDAMGAKGLKARPPKPGHTTMARVVQARRGHITRALVAELEQLLKGKKGR